MVQEKSSVITIRVKSSVKKKLESESDNASMTLSNLISKILTKHTEWDTFANEIGFVLSTRQFLRGILDTVPESKVSELAKTVCKNSFREAIIFMNGDLTNEFAIKTISRWLSASAIPYRIIQTNLNTKFIIQHNLGRNWSVYFLTLITEIFGEMGKGLSEKTIENDNLSFVVEK